MQDIYSEELPENVVYYPYLDYAKLPLDIFKQSGFFIIQEQIFFFKASF